LGATGSLPRPDALICAAVGWATGVATLSVQARAARTGSDLLATGAPSVAAKPTPIAPMR
jgi:hypothetical protein